MVILIDPSDRELYTLMKAIADSGYENVDFEHAVLMKMLEEQGRTIHIDYVNENNMRITFPKKKKFGIF